MYETGIIELAGWWHLLPWRNHQYGFCLETQFSRDLETARFEPGAAGLQSAALPQSYRASVWSVGILSSNSKLNIFSLSIFNTPISLSAMRIIIISHKKRFLFQPEDLTTWMELNILHTFASPLPLADCGMIVQTSGVIVTNLPSVILDFMGFVNTIFKYYLTEQ